MPGLILLRQKNSRLPPVNTTIPIAMAKNKGKRSSEANAAPPDGGVPVNTSNAGADNLPKLEENAFAGLRQKIEQKLKGENAAKQKPKNKAKDAAGDSEKKGKTASPKPASKQESNKNKGQKRDRNGDVIAREKSSGEEKSKPSNGNENDALRQEILALGGTQEDFDMLAGVGSESEVEDAADASKKSNKSNDASLRKELSSMLASAGQIAPGDLDEAEDGSEDNTKDEDGYDESLDGEQSEDENNVGEEISDVEEETPELPAEPAQEPSKPSKKEKAKESAETEPEDIIPKEYSKLVSISQCFSDIELIGCRLFLHDRTGTPLPCLLFRLQRKGNHSRAIW